MEYEEDIEAVSIDEAKKQFEAAVSEGQVEPTEARIIEYTVEPNV
jgi:hypothetical protein